MQKSSWKRSEQKQRKRGEQTSCRQKRRKGPKKLQIAKIEIEAAKEQAKIEADKELALKELELKALQDLASASLAATWYSTPS